VFVAAAGGTGRVSDAVIVMLAFWLGTLPMMLTLGFGVQRLFGPFRRHLPLAAAGVAVVLGLLSLAGKTMVRASVHTAHDTEVAHDGR
jgi:sulfite exporter TauE/SafE